MVAFPEASNKIVKIPPPFIVYETVVLGVPVKVIVAALLLQIAVALMLIEAVGSGRTVIIIC